MLAKDDFKRHRLNKRTYRHTNLLSRRHFEAVPECCAQSLPVAASVTAPLKIPAQFDKLLLSPSSRGNAALKITPRLNLVPRVLSLPREDPGNEVVHGYVPVTPLLCPGGRGAVVYH